MTWEQAKQYVDKMEYPDFKLFELEKTDEFHLSGKSHHQLNHYSLKDKHILGFLADLEYAKCPECNEVRWQRAAIFNYETNDCYQRFWIKDGKTV